MPAVLGGRQRDTAHPDPPYPNGGYLHDRPHPHDPAARGAPGATAVPFAGARDPSYGHRRSQSRLERPLVGLVVQGTKHSFMGGRDYTYGDGQSVVVAVDMPIISYVTDLSPDRPFLFIYLYLNKAMIASLVAEMRSDLPPMPEGANAVSVAGTDADILEMFNRLLGLLDKPGQISVRAPMMLRELHYLLLLSSHGPLLRQLNTSGTQNGQVARAIDWIRDNFRAPLRVEALARQVNMATATLHRHFKQITGLSPLQYQKQLRLYEAQRLMLVEDARVSSAALSVGYESVSQFNREYKRIFGEPPLRDMKRRRIPAG